MRANYTAIAERNGPWWAIRVAELPGVFSQAKRLDRVDAMARDAISLLLDIPPDSFDVTVRERLAPEAERVIADARKARLEAVERQEVASAKSREAVQTLTRLGLPQRDIGRLLDLSHQRVGQLATPPRVSRSRQCRQRPDVLRTDQVYGVPRVGDFTVIEIKELSGLPLALQGPGPRVTAR